MNKFLRQLNHNTKKQGKQSVPKKQIATPVYTGLIRVEAFAPPRKESAK